MLAAASNLAGGSACGSRGRTWVSASRRPTVSREPSASPGFQAFAEKPLQNAVVVDTIAELSFVVSIEPELRCATQSFPLAGITADFSVAAPDLGDTLRLVLASSEPDYAGDVFFKMIMTPDFSLL